MNLTPEQIERFWSKVDRSGGPSACHPWTAGRAEDGYGRFSDRGSHNVLANRVALSLHLGHEPVGLALHTCDNPPCCNPAHLYDGTHAQNMADARARGRRRGSRNGNARLTAAQVAEIRVAACAGRYKRGLNVQRELALRFGITQGMVSKIARGENWSASWTG